MIFGTKNAMLSVMILVVSHWRTHNYDITEAVALKELRGGVRDYSASMPAGLRLKTAWVEQRGDERTPVRPSINDVYVCVHYY